MAGDGTASAGGGVVVEFELADQTYPFVGLSAVEGCRVALELMLPRDGGRYAEFFTVQDADPARVLELAESDELVEPRLLRSYDDGGLFEFVVEGYCPARSLAERGAIPREVESEDGEGRIVAEIPETESPSAVITAFLSEHPAAVMVSKRQTDRLSPLLTHGEFAEEVSDRLTDRQEEALRTAFELGYYDRSDDAGGTAVAEELGISASTVSQHLQAAERVLVAVLLEDGR